MKQCKKCNEVKPLSEFYAAPGMRDGHRSEWESRNLTAQAAKNRANPQANRERVRQWRLANPERYAEQQAANVRSGQKAFWSRKGYLKRKYGMTLEQYEAMLE